MPVTLALGWLRQEDCFEFETLLSYIVSFRPTWVTVLDLKAKQKETTTTKQKERDGKEEKGEGSGGQAFPKAQGPAGLLYEVEP